MNNTFCKTDSFTNVNPIKRTFIHKNIHLNSKFRDDYYNTSSTNFKYTFSETLEKVVSIKLSSISNLSKWNVLFGYLATTSLQHLLHL